IRRIETKGELLAFSPDSKLLATTGKKGAAFLWNTATGEKARSLRCLDGNYISGGRFTLDGGTLVTTCGDRQVRRWNVVTGERLARLEIPLPQPQTLRLAPDA